MKVAIVFDSQTGTTEAAAEAMGDLIRAAGHSALAATECQMPHLAVDVIEQRLDVDTDGKVYGIDENGKFRRNAVGECGDHGQDDDRVSPGGRDGHQRGQRRSGAPEAHEGDRF